MKAKVKASGAEIEVQLTKLDTQFGIQEFTDKNGEKYQFYELDFLPDTPEEVTIEGWATKDPDFDVVFHYNEPYLERIYYNTDECCWRSRGRVIFLPDDLIPNLTTEKTKRVKITITPIE